MPTYTYRCLKCAHEFERLQSMSDEPVKRCPECKSKVQRVIHPVGIVLKGSGFHRNDYRTSKPSESSEKSGEKSDTTSGDTKSDSKSESASGSKPAEKKSETKKSEKKGD